MTHVHTQSMKAVCDVYTDVNAKETGLD